jgi:phosphomevalonate kinase
MNIQDEAYSEAMDEIGRLKKLLELRDVEIGALRREISRRNVEVEKLKTALQEIIDDVKQLKTVLQGIIDDDGHYPANAPIRKLIAEAENKI